MSSVEGRAELVKIGFWRVLWYGATLCVMISRSGSKICCRDEQA